MATRPSFLRPCWNDVDVAGRDDSCGGSGVICSAYRMALEGVYYPEYFGHWSMLVVINWGFWTL